MRLHRYFRQLLAFIKNAYLHSGIGAEQTIIEALPSSESAALGIKRDPGYQPKHMLQFLTSGYRQVRCRFHNAKSTADQCAFRSGHLGQLVIEPSGRIASGTRQKQPAAPGDKAVLKSTKIGLRTANTERREQTTVPQFRQVRQTTADRRVGMAAGLFGQRFALPSRHLS